MKSIASGLDLQLKLEKAIQGMTIEMTERSRLNSKDKQLQIMAGTLMMLKRLRGDFMMHNIKKAYISILTVSTVGMGNYSINIQNDYQQLKSEHVRSF